MTVEQISAAASVATVVVIAATAIAALIQLRHMSAGNQLDAILSLEADFRSAQVQEAL
ncbi:MAG: hypothetical protein M3Y21_04315 [Candidatus Eremiobacteraeota bacterium]|nr:hypothetical protein [Candidatus Eremiobacteraeota bacterium]